MQKKKYLVLSIIFLGLFAVFTYLVKLDVFTTLDYTATVKLQDNIPKSLDTVLSFLSIIGSIEIITVVLLGFIMIKRSIRFFFTSFFLYGFGHVLELLGKGLMNHPNPPHQFFRYNIGLLFPSAFVQTGSSYPSGHSYRMVFVAIIAFFIIKQMRKIPVQRKYFYHALIAVVTVAMLISRVSLGEHWLSDVIGGGLMGVGLGSLLLFL